MEVFIVEMDNGKEYEDYDHFVEGVFKSFRSASEFLIKKNFVPFAVKDNRYHNWELFFENTIDSYDKENNMQAWIFEMEVNE